MQCRHPHRERLKIYTVPRSRNTQALPFISGVLPSTRNGGYLDRPKKGNSCARLKFDPGIHC